MYPLRDLTVSSTARLLLVAALAGPLAGVPAGCGAADETVAKGAPPSEIEGRRDTAPTSVAPPPKAEEKPVGLTPPDAAAQRLIGRAIKETQRGTRLFDGLVQQVAGLSDPELRRCGELVLDAHIDEGKRLTEGPYVERAVRLATPVFAHGERPFDWKVSVVEDDTLNAFATAGGFIYLNTGLMDQLDDAQLTFVIGHEVGHIELAHTDSVWTYAERLGLLTGDNVSGLVMALLSQHVGVGYSEEQELEADAWGIRETEDLGVTPEDAIASFEIFAENSGESLEDEDPAANVLEELERQRQHHYRTHPPARDRIAQMRDVEAARR